MKQWSYGKDGVVHGPITETELQQLLSNGTLSADDLIWSEGMTDWEPAHKHFPGNALNPQTTPATSTAPTSPVVDPGSRNFDIGSCLQRAWDDIKKQPAIIIGGAFIAIIISALPQVPSSLGDMINITGSGSEPAQQAVFASFSVLMYLLSFVLAIVITPLITCGLFVMLLRIARGQNGRIEDLFSFFNLKEGGWAVATYFVMVVFIIGGLLLLILPGIYLAIAYSFVFIVIADRRLRLLEALEDSRKTITPVWWKYLLFVIVLGLLNLAGLLFCCVGLILTYPLSMLATTYAYLDLTGRTSEN